MCRWCWGSSFDSICHLDNWRKPRLSHHFDCNRRDTLHINAIISKMSCFRRTKRLGGMYESNDGTEAGDLYTKKSRDWDDGKIWEGGGHLFANYYSVQPWFIEKEKKKAMENDMEGYVYLAWALPPGHIEAEQCSEPLYLREARVWRLVVGPTNRLQIHLEAEKGTKLESEVPARSVLQLGDDSVRDEVRERTRSMLLCRREGTRLGLDSPIRAAFRWPICISYSLILPGSSRFVERWWR